MTYRDAVASYLKTRLTYRDAVASYLKTRPNQWVDGLELARIGGAYAWRSRLAECRTQLGMTIENSQVRDAHGKCRSRYRYVPKDTPDEPRPREHQWTTVGGVVQYPFCFTCGVIRRRDGQNGPCKGPTKLRPMEPKLRTAKADLRRRDDQS